MIGPFQVQLCSPERGAPQCATRAKHIKSLRCLTMSEKTIVSMRWGSVTNGFEEKRVAELDPLLD